MQNLLRLFERLSLPLQVLLLGASTTCLLLVLCGWLAGAPAPTLAAAAATGLMATLAGAWAARRGSRSLMAMTHAARQLGREDAADAAQVPYLKTSDEVQQATLALRHAFELARQRRLALEAHVAALGVQLRSRTQQLSSLEDLSIGLSRHTEISGLVNEALGALEQTMAYASASVWAREGLEPTQPVVLLGYRSSSPTGAAPDAAAAHTAELTGLRLSRGNLQRYEQIEREGQAIVENRPRTSLLSWLWEIVTDDARTSALYKSSRAWMAVPLKVRDRVLGVMRVDHAEPDYFDAERTRLLAAVGGQTALAMRHAHLLAQERDVAVAAERNRIARDLHDAVSQTLFAAQLLAGTLARSEVHDEATREQAQTLEALNRSALAELRMMLFELRPDALEGVRLPELLQQAVAALAGRGEIVVDSEIGPDTGLPAAQRIEIYRIAQEALSNLARHSGAKRARVAWTLVGPGHGRLQINDSGRGFDPAADYPGHLGLGHMRQRALALGANLEIHSSPEEGTRLALELCWQ